MDVETGAIGSLLPKLRKLLEEEHNLSKGVKDDIQFIKDELESWHALLCKLAEVPPDQLDEAAKLWVRYARGLSYRIEDSVDRRLNFQTKDKQVRHNMSLAMRDFKDDLVELSERRETYRLDEVDAIATHAAYTVDPRPAAHEAELVGAYEARDELIKMLTEGDKHQMKIVSIVGFGGLGKTALASMVYQKLKSQFDCAVFVSASPNPDMKEIFESMHVQLDEKMYTDICSVHKDEGQLIEEIWELLRNKRYLIVIDDLWNPKDWDTIRYSLPDSGYGSRVITTTRVNDVAQKCSGRDELIYEMKHLGYQNSKRLFLKRTFGSEVSCPDSLTGVLDEILKMCGGMPLAIISIASLLRSEVTTKESWQHIMSYLHSAREDDIPSLEVLRKILSLSYFHLPSTLKTCLLYLAVSAENQRIKRDNLVRKWVAEGFISEDGRDSREEEANRYFDELVNRNVIRPVEYGNCPGEKTYEIHYMMLYTLRVISEEEHFVTFFTDVGIPSPRRNPAYLLFIQCSDSGLVIDAAWMDLSHVRSVTMHGPAKLVLIKELEYIRLLDLDGCKDLVNTDVDGICRMILLRYLSLKQTRLTELPPEIGNLIYLETLDVRQTQITELPPQIGKLQNLETLDIRQTRVEELPKEVVQLPKLTHLHFGQSSSIGGVKLPAISNHLKSVKVLGAVDSRECSESVMQEISGLREVREITIVLYDGPADKQQNDKLLSSIGRCRNLESLTIYGDSNPSDKLPVSPNFPQLRKLKVAGRFVKVPGWIAQLRALTLLDIRVCKLEPNDLTILGDLPCLINLALVLVCLPREQVVITSSACFLNLEVFTFDCRVPWVTFEQGAMPRLEHLELKLYAGPAGKSPPGILSLQRLKKVILRYASQYASSVRVTETVDVMRKEAGSHANLIKLYVNGVQETFPSNTSVDRRISGNEIEE